MVAVWMLTRWRRPEHLLFIPFRSPLASLGDLPTKISKSDLIPTSRSTPSTRLRHVGGGTMPEISQKPILCRSGGPQIAKSMDFND